MNREVLFRRTVEFVVILAAAFLLLFLATRVAFGADVDYAPGPPPPAPGKVSYDLGPASGPWAKTTPRFPSEYRRLYDRVAAGERVTVTVGASSLEGYPGTLAPGTYEAFLLNGLPSLQRREVSRPVALPFVLPTGTIPTTVATSAVRLSTSWPTTTATVRTHTFVLGAGIPGGTDGCPPSG